MPHPPEMLETLVDTYLSALSENKAHWLATFHPAAEVFDPADKPALTGHQALANLYTNNIESVQNVHAQRTGPIRIAGNRVAFPFSLSFRRAGRAMQLEIIDILTVDESGKITRLEAYWSKTNLRSLGDTNSSRPD